MNKNRSIISGLDWWTIGLFLVISLFGWLNIYGSSFTFEQTSIWDFSHRAGKQFMWIMTAIAMGTIIVAVEEKIYDILGYIFYGAMILLLLITPLLARDINGSLSWINIGSVSLQPAEFAKCFTAIAVAKYMSRYGYRVRDLRDLFVPFAIIAVPMMIIMVAQRDTGSALVFLSFLLVFYREGMSGYVLLWGVFSILLFIIVIRFGGVAVPVGTGNVGILAGSLLIEAITVGLLVYREKDIRIAIIVVGYSIDIFAIG